MAVGNVNGISIFLNNGGTSLSRADYTIPTVWVRGIASGDFNGDGKADLIASSDSNVLNIFLGNGDGTFQASETWTHGGGYPLFVADFNRDGIADVVAGSQVLLGNGNGTFSIAVSSVAPIAVLAVGDFNGDNIPDLAGAMADDHAGVYAYVALGNGDGTFQTPSRRKIALPISGFAPQVPAMEIADVDGDGKPDLIVDTSSLTVGVYTGKIAVLPGNGDGTLRDGWSSDPRRSPRVRSPWKTSTEMEA